MERRLKRERGVLYVMKTLLAGYMITGVFLLILALALYKFSLNEKQVTSGIMVIYFISNLICGFLIGKCMKVRRFWWGILTGFLYFMLLLIISVGVNHSLKSNGVSLLAAFLLCTAGGMIGGMVS